MDYIVRVHRRAASRDPAQLSQPLTAPSEDGPQQPRHGEDLLPVRHERENVLIDPLAIQEHALMVATGSEIARLAGEGEQIVVHAGVAVDAREAVVRITAFEKAVFAASCPPDQTG